mmetsp:Transcript_12555/g.29981  ORF Transcript_12555/g.29981 Transcript_12555/m.29981 type:complete len:267 (+) Transcript_12555:334-1134(+)
MSVFFEILVQKTSVIWILSCSLYKVGFTKSFGSIQTMLNVNPFFFCHSSSSLLLLFPPSEYPNLVLFPGFHLVNVNIRIKLIISIGCIIGIYPITFTHPAIFLSLGGKVGIQTRKCIKCFFRQHSQRTAVHIVTILELSQKQVASFQQTACKIEPTRKEFGMPTNAWPRQESTRAVCHHNSLLVHCCCWTIMDYGFHSFGNLLFGLFKTPSPIPNDLVQLNHSILVQGIEGMEEFVLYKIQTIVGFDVVLVLYITIAIVVLAPCNG